MENWAYTVITDPFQNGNVYIGYIYKSLNSFLIGKYGL